MFCFYVVSGGERYSDSAESAYLSKAYGMSSAFRTHYRSVIHIYNISTGEEVIAQKTQVR
jgi:hypothetical protein